MFTDKQQPEYVLHRGRWVGVPAGGAETASPDITPNMARFRSAATGALAGIGGGIGVVLGTQLAGPTIGPALGGLIAGAFIGGDAGKIVAVTGAMDAVIATAAGNG